MKNIGLTVKVTGGTAQVKVRGSGTPVEVAKDNSFTDVKALSVKCKGNDTAYTLELDGKPLANVTNPGGQLKLKITGRPAAGKVIQCSISKKGNKYRVKAVRVPINAGNRPPLCGGIIVV